MPFKLLVNHISQTLNYFYGHRFHSTSMPDSYLRWRTGMDSKGDPTNNWISNYPFKIRGAHGYRALHRPPIPRSPPLCYSSLYNYNGQNPLNLRGRGISRRNSQLQKFRAVSCTQQHWAPSWHLLQMRATWHTTCRWGFNPNSGIWNSLDFTSRGRCVSETCNGDANWGVV